MQQKQQPNIDLSGKIVLQPVQNFSYKTIPLNCCLEIGELQEMLLFNEILIDGTLIIDGDLAFLE